ncbi:hypothetical protein G6F65_016581 [Rhizopus arrhizus]|nr:hypothetical protein G6F65_016581 [Rhizopus arrhizus]
MQFELRSIQKKIGTTTVMVTHDQAEALSISDRVVVMQDGRATQVDAPFRMYEHPQTEFISRFVGKTNLLAGRVTRCGAQAEIETGALRVVVDGEGLRHGDSVQLSLRPEKLVPVPAGQGKLSCVVNTRYFLGSQWMYDLDSPVGALTVLTPNDGRRPHDDGEAIGLDWAEGVLRPRNEGLLAILGSIPLAIVFLTLVLTPLALTFVLSFRPFDYGAGVLPGLTIEHYLAVVTDSYFLEIFWRTFWIAGVTTLICVLIGAPEAYILSRMGKPWRSIFLLVVLSPLLISLVVRAFGWSMLLGPSGAIGRAASALGLGPLLYTPTAVIIGLVHVMLPFMVIPIWTSLQKLDPTVEHAALRCRASCRAA